MHFNSPILGVFRSVIPGKVLEGVLDGDKLTFRRRVDTSHSVQLDCNATVVKQTLVLLDASSSRSLESRPLCAIVNALKLSLGV